MYMPFLRSHGAKFQAHPNSCPHGAFTENIRRAPIGSFLQAGTVAQRFGRDLLVVVLHLLSNPSCRRELGASWTDAVVTLVAGVGSPAAEVAGLVAHPLPLAELARVVAQLGCDHGLHQHVPLRAQRSPFAEVSMSLCIRLCHYTIHTVSSQFWSCRVEP